MKVLATTARLAVACVAAALASCIDSREEAWLHADGSGSAKLEYSIPAAAARLQGGEEGIRKLIREFIHTSPGLRLDRNEVSSAAGRTKIEVALSFDSQEDLIETITSENLRALPSAASHVIGDIRTEMQGLSMTFDRSLNPSMAIPGVGFVPTSQLAPHQLKTIMHLPYPVRRTNATRTENEGRTLVWEHRLEEAVKGPIHQQFEMQVPIPRTAIIGGAMALATIGVLVVRPLRRKWKQAAGETSA